MLKVFYPSLDANYKQSSLACIPDDKGCKFLIFLLSPCSYGYGRLINLSNKPRKES